MRIIRNGEDCEVIAKALDEILLEQGYKTDAIATAVNGTFVHKQYRREMILKEGDRLEVVAPIQGG